MKISRGSCPTTLVLLAATAGVVATIATFTNPAAAATPDTQVKYDRKMPLPPAEFVPLSTVEIKSITAPQLCHDATFQNQFRVDPAFQKKHLADWKKQAQCAQGIAKATALGQEISGIDTAAYNSVRALKESLEQTKQALAKRTTIDGLLLVAIPIGGFVPNGYQSAKSIEVKCVSGVEKAVGRGIFTEGFEFKPVTPEQTAKIAELKKNAAEIQARYNGLATDYAKNGGKGSFLEATWARAAAIAADFGNLLNSAKADFVLLTPEAVDLRHSDLKLEQKFSISFRMTPGKQVEVPSLPKIIRDHGGVPSGAVFETGTVKVGDKTFLGLPIPATHTLDGFRKGVDMLLKSFTTGEFFVFDEKTNEFVPDKKKEGDIFAISEAALKLRRDALQAKLDALKTENYNCTTSATPPPPTNLQSSLTPSVQGLREYVEELKRERDGLKVQIEGIRRQRNYSPSPLLEQQSNTTPLRRQLGDIAEALGNILKALQEASML
ncbi:MAG: hypothetical protein HYW65_01735 [Candidatus Liptonbacteria bacterium]|nr:hypothetical protein [Candidatus Liptonbacteria bacterium]